MARLVALPCAAPPVAPPVAPTAPTARAGIASTFADLPPAYQEFATQHALTFRDVLGLLSAPTLHEHLTAHRLTVLVAQLEEAVQHGAHQMCEMVLCILIKSDLRHPCDAVIACDLRRVVTRFECEWRGAGTDATAPLARLGRVLLVKLDNMGERLDCPEGERL